MISQEIVDVTEQEGIRIDNYLNWVKQQGQPESHFNLFQTIFCLLLRLGPEKQFTK